MLLKNIIQIKHKTNRHTMAENDHHEYFKYFCDNGHIECLKYFCDYGHLECFKYVCEFNKAKIAEILFGHSRLPKKNKKQWMWKKKEKLSKSENRGLKK